MEKNRKVWSIKDELIKKSREAIMAAVQIYNNPNITFKSETYITLSIIGWTYLLHAYYRSINLDYRYYKEQNERKKYDKTKYGAYKYWELERCLNEKDCPLDDEVKYNLKYLIGIRNEIEHQMTRKIDEFISAKLQACAINYNYYIGKLFGDKYKVDKELSLTIQFSSITPEQKDYLLNNEKIESNINNFITDFEKPLDSNILLCPRYAYRIAFVPISVNRQGQADSVIEFVKADSPFSKELSKSFVIAKETEKKKYLPKQIIEIMHKEGYMDFTIKTHTDLWKRNDAKNPKFNYGVMVVKQWYWYENWLNEVRKYCEASFRIK